MSRRATQSRQSANIVAKKLRARRLKLDFCIGSIQGIFSLKSPKKGSKSAIFEIFGILSIFESKAIALSCGLIALEV